MAHEDAVYYEIVANELGDGDIQKGLWTKALTKSLGDESLARPVYIEWRVEQLKEQATQQSQHEARERHDATVDGWFAVVGVTSIIIILAILVLTG